MRTLTYSLSYYNQGKEAIMKHINMWKEYPKEIRDKISFYLMDDCSKEPLNEVLKDEDFQDLDIHIYCVEVDLYCNISGIRNLSARECKTDWMIVLDMDTLVPVKMAFELIKLIEKNQKGVSYKFNRIVPDNKRDNRHGKTHPAVCLLRIDDYWKVGGCEEDLVGNYGMTDPTFFWKAKGKMRVVEMRNIFMIHYSEGEADIVRNVSKNRELFEKRKRDGKWSTDYIRFPWKKVK